jgi:hypothetical protein
MIIADEPRASAQSTKLKYKERRAYGVCPRTTRRKKTRLFANGRFFASSAFYRGTPFRGANEGYLSNFDAVSLRRDEMTRARFPAEWLMADDCARGRSRAKT